MVSSTKRQPAPGSSKARLQQQLSSLPFHSTQHLPSTASAPHLPLPSTSRSLSLLPVPGAKPHPLAASAPEGIAVKPQESGLAKKKSPNKMTMKQKRRERENKEKGIEFAERLEGKKVQSEMKKFKKTRAKKVWD